MSLYEDYHARVEALTGDPWCPYPSDLFMQAVMEATDKEAIILIEGRRKYRFPAFLAGEPQRDAIKAVLDPPDGEHP